jgi:hypothetical protein
MPSLRKPAYYPPGWLGSRLLKGFAIHEVTYRRRYTNTEHCDNPTGYLARVRQIEGFFKGRTGADIAHFNADNGIAAPGLWCVYSSTR